MKKVLVRLLLVVSSTFTHGEELDFILPNGVDYKIQQVKDKELHLFRLTKHPIDTNHWGPDLPMLILMRMDCEAYSKSIRHFDGKSNNEIESEFLQHIASQSSHTVHSLKYSEIHLGVFTGHRIQIDTEVSHAGVVRRFTILNTYIETDESCWMANGMSLRHEEDIQTVDAILKSIRISCTTPLSQKGDDNS